MNKKEQLLKGLQKKREPKDYVREYLKLRVLLETAGYVFTKIEYCNTVELPRKTFSRYCSKYEDEVVQELIAERKRFENE